MDIVGTGVYRVASSDKRFYCKKCGRSMDFVVESEKLSNGVKRIVYYYKCPVCGYRVDVEQVNVGVEKDYIVVRRRVRLV